MMWKVLPDIFPKENIHKRFDNMVFFVDEDNTRKLYKIEYDEIEDCYAPSLISNLPSFYYENVEKRNHIISFLEKNNVNFKIEKNSIVIFDPNTEEYTLVEAPLYIQKDESFCKKGIHKEKMPTKNMGIAACKYAMEWYDKITVEEFYFDFENLSLDGSKSAFLEEYPSYALNLLNKNKFLFVDLPSNPNPYDIPYNEYSYNCWIIPEESNGFLRGRNIVAFNREIIAKHLINGETSVTLPKEVAAVIIGKSGENMKSLLYNLGVNRLNINENLKEAI